jgi:hypothetical protein
VALLLPFARQPLGKPGGGPQLLALRAGLLLSKNTWLLLLLLLLGPPMQLPLDAAAVLLWLHIIPRSD